jgi:hypothetical protein
VLDELTKLWCNPTTVDYQNKYSQLVNRCDNLSKKHQIDIFTIGLNNPLKTDVELEQLATLEEAMTLARAYEQRLSMVDDVTLHTLSRLASKPLALPTPTMALGDTSSTNATLPPTPSLKRLIVVEMAAKQEKGECYNCTEKFSREHLQISPMKGNLLL